MLLLHPLLAKIFPGTFYVFPEKTRRTAGIALTYTCQENCGYCLAKNLPQAFPPHITLEDFNKSLQWLIKQNFSFITIVGGEPTAHPQFFEICNIIKLAIKDNPKLQILLMTRKFILKHIFDNIAEYKNRFFIQVNLSNDDLNSTEKLKTLSDSFNYIKNKGGYLSVRTVLQGENDNNFELNTLRLIDFLSSHKLNLRFSFDSCIRISEKTMAIRAEKAINFIENCIRKKVRVKLVRSIPSCFFDQTQLKKYSNYLILNCFKGIHEPLPHFVINPDLSSFMCCSAHYRIKNVLQYESISGLLEKYKAYLTRYLSEPAFQRCAKCDKFKKKACLGGCLGQRGGIEKIIDI